MGGDCFLYKANALERQEDHAEEPGFEAQAGDAKAQESVSQILQRAREDYGQDLRSVSDSLRIRYIYLLAIEEGRFNDLPGATYAVGFVRTYADYLGLDSEEIVRRFKAEVKDLDGSTQLVFPVPKPEGKIPGGAIILISLLLVGVAYGGWYVLSQNEGSLVEIFSGEEDAETGVAALPEGAPEEQPAATDAEPETAPAPETTENGAPAQQQSGQAAVETLPEDDPVETEVLPPLDGSQEGGSETATAEAPAAGTEAPEAAAAEPAEEDPAEEEAAADPPAPGTGEQAAQDSASTGIPAAPQSDQLASAPSGRVFGEEEGSVRIVVRAKQDAWVQVRDSENQLLLTEVLRSGDVYRVPNTQGLTMLTGNAGGLEIRVDGEVAPTLGPVGVVRRNVALDPQRLSDGTAVGEDRTQE